ncbi:MFS transporter [Evansella cellulosilytica]|uniref:Major facilitator superfamily MFS_1 n=1 Tax=Evansella cellulosilytica (strain ATCC 21833 / DSM 2522 / FERM P-1141 / JCM 9156 / N-4) TaxID=649639 RepID=E6U265_EVAC2|nr:MFS transporter [Evansella cellulosilytica]ADU30443.1 major facilitator superfamily MFS_1 [Evansella cellulosilytica DSM 2522]
MLVFLYSIIIVAFLDTFIQLPIISPFAKELGASSFLSGMIIAIYSFSNMIGNAISGHWIDRYGRKKILLIGMIAVTFILFLYPFVTSGNQLLLVRFIHGLAGGALIPAAFAYLGDLAPSKNRGKAMAFSGGCIGTAAIVGPALGGIISSRLSVSAVFIFVGVIFLITVIVVSLWLKESFHKDPRQHKKVELADFIVLIKNSFMIQAMIGAFALMCSMGILTYALPLKVQSLSLSSTVTGILLSTFGIVALIIFLTPINRSFDIFKPQSFIRTGLLLISFALISLSFLDSIIFISITMVIYGIGFAFVFPSMNRIVVDISSNHDRGKAFGLFYGAFSLGVVFGSIFAGTMAEAFGKPFLVSGIFMLFIVAVFSIHVKHCAMNPEMN